jgi:GTPase SAR1 family protein
VGNKVDLSDKREVSTQEGKDLAAKNKLLFFECSAKTGYNIDEVFTESAKAIAQKIKEKYYDLSSEICGIKTGMNIEGTPNANIISLDDIKTKKKKGCC